MSEIVFDQRLQCVNEKTRLPNVTELVNKIDQFFVLIGKLSFGLPTYKLYPTKEWKEFEQVGIFVYE